MPVSYGYASGSVHVLEGRLMGRERIERILAAADGQEAIKVLQEAGYGRGEEISGVADYERWLQRRSDEVHEYVGRYSPEPAATDCFLLRIDYTNLKILYKARHLEQDAAEILRGGGLLAVETVADAVREQDYRRLSGPMQAALKALDQRSAAGNVDPRLIDTTLDRAMFAQIEGRVGKAKSKAVKAYFRDLADLTNLRTALRARSMGMTREELAEQLVTGGEVKPEALLLAMDEPERALAAFSGRSFKRQLDEAVAAYGQDGSLSRFELMLDNHLLALIKAGQWNNTSVEPMVGYMLGVEREIAAIRLCMVGRINDFPADAVRERLGDLYV